MPTLAAAMRPIFSPGPAAMDDEEGGIAGLSFRSEVDLDGDAVRAPIANSYKLFAYGF